MTTTNTSSILAQIKLKLSSSEDNNKNYYTSNIFSLTKSLENEKPNIDEFQKFIIEIHDLLVTGINCII